jgi:hypothetical protein
VVTRFIRPPTGPATIGNVVTRAELLGGERTINAGATLTTTRGTPMRLVQNAANMAGRPAAAGRIVTLVGPAGAERALNLGGLNRVTRTATQGRVATAGGVVAAQNVQNPLLTRYLNEVYAPLVVQTVGRPTTIVARRTVGNVGSVTVGNVQGGVTISGPQGSMYIPAQELLAATAG